MTRFLLVRHAHHGLVGKALAGRSDSVGLDASGIAQAEGLAARLASAGVTAIYVSPQRRARETAGPVAARLDLDPIVEPALDEIDFGAWTGKSFADLSGDPQWTLWCEKRSLARPPAGERLVDAQQRALAAMRRLMHAHDAGTVALVSHGDVIKAVIAHVLSSSLDELERFDIAPASVSCITAHERHWQLTLLNSLGT